MDENTTEASFDSNYQYKFTAGEATADTTRKSALLINLSMKLRNRF